MAGIEEFAAFLREQAEDTSARAAMAVAELTLKAILLCTCVAYNRVEDFPRVHKDLISNKTKNGKQLLKVLNPIVKRTPDTLDAFLRDTMITTRDFLQKLFENGVYDSEPEDDEEEDNE